MKKKILAIGSLVIVMASLFSIPTFAARESFSISVSPMNNNGVNFSGGNAKDDNEQAAYIHTYNTPNWGSSLLYLGVYGTPRDDSACQLTYMQKLYNTNDYVSHYVYAHPGTGYVAYLKLDTDMFAETIYGYWYA